MTITMTIDTTDIGFTDMMIIDVVDTSNPDTVILSTKVTVDGENIERSFVMVKMSANNFRISLFGWQIGSALSAQDVTFLLSTSTPGSKSEVHAITVRELDNAYLPIMQWIKDLIMSDPILVELAEQVRFSRPIGQYRSETASYYVYPAEMLFAPNLASFEMTHNIVMRVSLLSDMTNFDEDEEASPHHVFVSRLVSLLQMNPTADPALKLISIVPRTANIPWNAFVYGNLEESWVDIRVQKIIQNTGE